MAADKLFDDLLFYVLHFLLYFLLNDCCAEADSFFCACLVLARRNALVSSGAHAWSFLLFFFFTLELFDHAHHFVQAFHIGTWARHIVWCRLPAACSRGHHGR